MVTREKQTAGPLMQRPGLLSVPNSRGPKRHPPGFQTKNPLTFNDAQRECNA